MEHKRQIDRQAVRPTNRLTLLRIRQKKNNFFFWEILLLHYECNKIAVHCSSVIASLTPCTAVEFLNKTMLLPKLKGIRNLMGDIYFRN